MTEPIRQRSRFRRLLVVFGIFLLLVGVGALIGLLYIPGGISHLELSYRPPPGQPPAPVMVADPAAPPRASAGEAPRPSAPPEAAKKLYLTYTLPTGLLQREVGAIFPITEGVEGMLKLILSNPRFVPDPDPSFLRLTLDLVASVGGTQPEQFPGTAVVRTQVRFSGSSVALHNAQLAEFRFSGAAAQVAESLRPVIETELASEMNGYVVFRMPKNANWWMKSGVAFVQDVVVENGRVVVVIGR